jgi:hypothetical protein
MPETFCRRAQGDDGRQEGTQAVTRKASTSFRRAVLGMTTGGVDRHVLQAAGEFARLLELEMLGVFIEDQALIDLAALPFARELRLPECEWRILEPQRVDDELRAAAQQAGRLFRREIESQGLTCRFEVRRGNPVTLASNVVRATDVLILAEAAAVDLVGPGREAARQAAEASAAAVLLLPRSGMPRHGPVAAVAASRSDPCFELAARIATATGEKALAIPPVEPATSAALMESLQRVLGSKRERLLVLRRDAKMPTEMFLEVASRRQTPVLVAAP